MTKFQAEYDDCIKYVEEQLQQSNSEDTNQIYKIIIENIQLIKQEFINDVNELKQTAITNKNPLISDNKIKYDSLLFAITEQYITQLWSIVVQLLENIYDEKEQEELQTALQYDTIIQNQSSLQLLTSNALQTCQLNNQLLIDLTSNVDINENKLIAYQKEIQESIQKKEIQAAEYVQQCNGIANKTQDLYQQIQQIQQKEKEKEIQKTAITSTLATVRQTLQNTKAVDSKLLSLKTVLSTINDIYKAKYNQDQTAINNDSQIQNIRLFHFKYFKNYSTHQKQFNEKFLYSLQKYSNSNFECLLYLMELQNQIGEDFKLQMQLQINKLFKNELKWKETVQKYSQNKPEIQEALSLNIKLNDIEQCKNKEQQKIEIYAQTFKIYDLNKTGFLNCYAFDKILLTFGIDKETDRLKLTNRASRGQQYVDFTQGWIIVQEILKQQQFNEKTTQQNNNENEKIEEPLKETQITQNDL